MFQEFQIAKAKHAEMDARFTSAKLAEGMTVEVLNVFDRALLDLRTALAKLASHAAQVRRTASKPAPAGIPSASPRAAD